MRYQAALHPDRPHCNRIMGKLRYNPFILNFFLPKQIQ
jgi:hypothetical protein